MGMPNDVFQKCLKDLAATFATAEAEMNRGAFANVGGKLRKSA
jgi:hypothetical protein